MRFTELLWPLWSPPQAFDGSPNRIDAHSHSIPMAAGPSICVDAGRKFAALWDVRMSHDHNINLLCAQQVTRSQCIGTARALELAVFDGDILMLQPICDRRSTHTSHATGKPRAGSGKRIGPHLQRIELVAVNEIGGKAIGRNSQVRLRPASRRRDRVMIAVKVVVCPALKALPKAWDTALCGRELLRLDASAEPRAVFCLKDIAEQHDSIVAFLQLVQVSVECPQVVAKTVALFGGADVKIGDCGDSHASPGPCLDP